MLFINISSAHTKRLPQLFRPLRPLQHTPHGSELRNVLRWRAVHVLLSVDYGSFPLLVRRTLADPNVDRL